MRALEAGEPMLGHGLRGFNGARIHAPRAVGLRSAEDFLAERFELFRRSNYWRRLDDR